MGFSREEFQQHVRGEEKKGDEGRYTKEMHEAFRKREDEKARKEREARNERS